MQLALNYVHTAVCHAAKPGSGLQATCTAYRRADTHICRIRAAVRIIFVSVYAVRVCVHYVCESLYVCADVLFLSLRQRRHALINIHIIYNRIWCVYGGRH